MSRTAEVTITCDICKVATVTMKLEQMISGDYAAYGLSKRLMISGWDWLENNDRDACPACKEKEPISPENP